MAIEQELNKTNPLHKEFQDLLDQDFKNRKVKETNPNRAIPNVNLSILEINKRIFLNIFA